MITRRQAVAGLAAGLATTSGQLLMPNAAMAAAVVGSVARLKNDASLLRAATVRAAEPGVLVELNDELRTGAQSRLEVDLKDETKITLGATASITVDRFVYDPDRSKGGMTVNVLKGAFRFVSGGIGKSGEKDIVAKTEFGIIGVRGTDFWGGPIDGAFGVLLLSGAVEVTTPGGSVVLDEPGAGTTIGLQRDAAPGAKTTWPNEKVQRAFSTVAF